MQPKKRHPGYWNKVHKFRAICLKKYNFPANWIQSQNIVWFRLILPDQNRVFSLYETKSQKFIAPFLIVQGEYPRLADTSAISCWLKDPRLSLHIITPALGIDVVHINHRCSLGFQLVGRRKRTRRRHTLRNKATACKLAPTLLTVLHWKELRYTTMTKFKQS